METYLLTAMWLIHQNYFRCFFSESPFELHRYQISTMAKRSGLASFQTVIILDELNSEKKLSNDYRLFYGLVY